MPQHSVSYACGRIGVLRRNALGAPQLDRLMATHTYEEACRTLVDLGFMSAEGTDFQAAADAHAKQACELLVAITPDQNLTDCFLLRYDVHNLKVLLKSRFLAQEPEFLSSCGTMRVDMLRHAVAEHRYNELPLVFKTALDDLEKSMAKAFDPMLIDAELDRAMYRLIFEKLAHVKQKTVQKYFTAKVDLQNYIMLLRVKAMRKDAAFFSKLFLPCGSIPEKELAKAFDEPERLAMLVKRYGDNVWRAALTCAINPAKLPLMEKTADDYLYGLFAGARYQNASVEVLISYLLKAQREATDVRLIMAGKLNGFKREELEERVRELNG